MCLAVNPQPPGNKRRDRSFAVKLESMPENAPFLGVNAVTLSESSLRDRPEATLSPLHASEIITSYHLPCPSRSTRLKRRPIGVSSMQLSTNCETAHLQSSTRKQVASPSRKKDGRPVPVVALGSMDPARLTFAEDFFSEHSSSFAKSRRPDVLGRAGKSNFERTVSSQFIGFPS